MFKLPYLQIFRKTSRNGIQQSIWHGSITFGPNFERNLVLSNALNLHLPKPPYFSNTPRCKQAANIYWDSPTNQRTRSFKKSLIEFCSSYIGKGFFLDIRHVFPVYFLTNYFFWSLLCPVFTHTATVSPKRTLKLTQTHSFAHTRSGTSQYAIRYYREGISLAALLRVWGGH